MVLKSPFWLVHKQQTNLRLKLPTIPLRVSGQDRKKNCPLSELIRLHDLEDSTLSQAQKKIIKKCTVNIYLTFLTVALIQLFFLKNTSLSYKRAEVKCIKITPWGERTMCSCLQKKQKSWTFSHEGTFDWKEMDHFTVVALE